MGSREGGRASPEGGQGGRVYYIHNTIGRDTEWRASPEN